MELSLRAGYIVCARNISHDIRQPPSPGQTLGEGRDQRTEIPSTSPALPLPWRKNWLAMMNADGILLTMTEQGKRYDMDVREYIKQFENRKFITTPGIITFMLSKGIVRTTLQAQFVLSGSIVVMLLIISYQWFGSVLIAPPGPTQAQIDEAFPTPSAPAANS